ncbi:MAG: signal recognition particle-docking protein FtsY [Mesorhizobium sp.]|uniref:signal recognition particle-docking protein FtsY n=1 Tax=Mesorhizobium sp. TaxID=1871066 RepID=UPI000FE6F226|nr:signal recognition particle-docking protein FtsY [Mesorhizobium sp.]RWL89794.1 MAG: signal recognition particle-docking protein FtsY [Mesorhizobium sp.]TIP47440.1 MAG: signal recognition particle-docking protein FtsY [Mesorhizobium sp.]
MAGFFKKIFSFGKKEVVEERVDETAPLPPIKWDQLDALKPEPDQAEPTETLAREQEPVAEAAPANKPALAPAPLPEEPKPEPAPTIPPTPEPIVPGEPEPLPEPEPEEEPQPAPQIPEPPVPEEVPPAQPEPSPAPEPAPQEVPAPAPAEPDIVPSRPEPRPEPAPVEVPAPPSEVPAETPAPIEVPPAEVPSIEPSSAEAGAATLEPSAEIAPPIRQPAPVEPQPILAEIAPESEAVPSPPKPAVGKVTVSKKVEQRPEPVKASEPAPRRSWFQRMRDGLARSSRELTGNIAGVFTKRKLDEDTLQDLEDVLIRADLGVETALRVTDSLASSRYGRDVSDSEVRAVMAAEVEKVLTPVAKPLELDLNHKPHVILVVGVNGTGKTTTIGKLAAKLTDGGLKVMLAAGDTFRAAAIEQLKIWGERTKSPVIATKLGADAAGLAYDAFEKAKEAGSDVLIIDTAGRLQNKTELMAELEKIVRVLGKLDPEAPHTVLQTVDATTGQNALNQVEIFRNVAGVNGLVMTKLDGTARGGILVAIAAKHRLPVYFIGVGEQVDDLEPFSASEFARAIAGVA